MSKGPKELVREEVLGLTAYPVAPAPGMVKLDAMENPYRLPAELARAMGERLAGVAINRYPDPTAPKLRQRLREAMAIAGSLEIVLGNGSDELLLEHREVFARQTAAIVAERERLARDLDAMARVRRFPSAANFILVRVPDAPAAFEALRQRGILVRNFHGSHPLLAHCLRLTVGTPDENARMLEALASHLA